MAKITIEDCLDYVENRFELVLIASKRARELADGAQPFFEEKKHEKSTVIALREIGLGLIPARNITEYIAWQEHRKEILRNESFELEL